MHRPVHLALDGDVALAFEIAECEPERGARDPEPASELGVGDQDTVVPAEAAERGVNDVCAHAHAGEVAVHQIVVDDEEGLLALVAHPHLHTARGIAFCTFTCYSSHADLLFRSLAPPFTRLPRVGAIFYARRLHNVRTNCTIAVKEGGSDGAVHGERGGSDPGHHAPGRADADRGKADSCGDGRPRVAGGSPRRGSDPGR